MQIILMRHGKPTVDLDTIKRKRVSPQAVGKSDRWPNVYGIGYAFL